MVKLAADGSQRLVNVTDVTSVSNDDSANSLAISKESSIANPQKIEKISSKCNKNRSKLSWQPCFRHKQPRN
jgi:hypothetical protein